MAQAQDSLADDRLRRQIAAASEYGHGKRRNVLSDYTFAVWDRDPSVPEATLVNVGKAYSGVTDAEIDQAHCGTVSADHDGPERGACTTCRRRW